MISSYKAGVLTLYMTPEQAERWNDGAIDSDGPDGESVKVSWKGLAQPMTLRDLNSLIDVLELKGAAIFADSLTAPAELKDMDAAFPVSRADAIRIVRTQNQIADSLADLYVQTGLLTEEVRLAFGPRPQVWLKVKKL